MINDYALEALQVQGGLAKEFRVNQEEFTVEDAQGASLSRVFQTHLLKWRPWDTRWYLQYVQEGFNHEPSELSALLYRHLKLGLLGEEDRVDGSSVEIGIFLNAHMKDFEQYNKLVEDSWESDEFEYDMATGNVHRKFGTKRGGIASTIAPPSPHRIAVPDTHLETDELLVPRPEADWDLRAVWRIDVQVVGSLFKLAHSVKIPGGATLLVSSETGGDLSKLAGHMMHVVFGHKDKKLTEGDFADGLRQLLAGEKAPQSFIPTVSPSRSPGFWEGSIGFLMGLSKFMMLAGFLYLIYVVYSEGWDVGISDLKISFVIMIGGSILAAILVPISAAMKEKAAARSIGY